MFTEIFTETRVHNLLVPQFLLELPGRDDVGVVRFTRRMENDLNAVSVESVVAQLQLYHSHPPMLRSIACDVIASSDDGIEIAINNVDRGWLVVAAVVPDMLEVARLYSDVCHKLSYAVVTAPSKNLIIDWGLNVPRCKSSVNTDQDGPKGKRKWRDSRIFDGGCNRIPFYARSVRADQGTAWHFTAVMKEWRTEKRGAFERNSTNSTTLVAHIKMAFQSLFEGDILKS
jgi:hypothetical protein